MTPLRQRFSEDLQRRNYSPRTVDCYVHAVAAFALHFGRSPERLDAEHVRHYQLHLIAQGASWSRFNQAAAALRFLYGRTLGRPDVAHRIPYGKRPKSLPCVLSHDEIRLLFQHASPPWFLLFLQTTYAGGLRVSETCRLKVTDIDSCRMVIHIRCAKGQKDRLVPLSAALLGLLRAYWRRRRPPDWLFPGRHGKPLCQGSVQRLFRHLVRATAIKKKASLHTLRHSYATHLLEQGCDLASLQKLLGHQQISTTLLYTHVQQSHLQKVGSPLDTLLAVPGPEPAAEVPVCVTPAWMSAPSCVSTPRQEPTGD